MSNSEEESESECIKVDQVVDSKAQPNGTVLYKVKWVSFSWVPEEYFASRPNLLKSFWQKKQVDASSDGKQGLSGPAQELHLKVLKLQRKLNAEYGISNETTKKSSLDYGGLQQEISTNKEAIDTLTSQIKELQTKLEAERGTRDELVDIIGKLLFAQEKADIQTKENTKKITVNKEAIELVKNEVQLLKNHDERDLTEVSGDLVTCDEAESHELQDPSTSDNSINQSSVFVPNIAEENELQDNMIEIEIDPASILKVDMNKSSEVEPPMLSDSINRNKKKLLNKKVYPKRDSLCRGNIIRYSKRESNLSTYIYDKSSILYLPGPIVNLRTAVQFKLKNLKTEDDFRHYAELLSPTYGQLISYQCKFKEKGISRNLQCFIKKSPVELKSIDSNLHVHLYSRKYFSKIHWSVSPTMQKSLISLGHTKSELPLVEIEPMTQGSSVTRKSNPAILNAILNSQGPLATRQSCREGFKSIGVPVSTEDFAYHADILTPEFGNRVTYDVVHRRNLVCFIKKPPSELDKSDVDVFQYAKRYAMSIHYTITPVMQIALKDHGYISAELITKSQELLSANMSLWPEDEENNDSFVDEIGTPKGTDTSILSTEDTPLPDEPNEDIIRCILNGQGPLVSVRSLRCTFKRLMKGITAEDFSSHCKLLSPDYGQYVSYRCPRFRGKSPIMKCFIKKPPSELSGSDIDLKRYSKRYYAPIHATFTPAMQLSLRKSGHLSEEVFTRPGIFSKSIQQEAADTEEENRNDADVHEEEELSQAVAICDKV